MVRLPASRFNNRFEFYERQEIDDGVGNFRSKWVSKFTVWANLTYRDGSEEVMAAALTGKQPAFLYLRLTPDTAKITPAWCCRDIQQSTFDNKKQQFKGAAYNIQSLYPDPDNKQYLRIVMQSGVALG